MKKERKALAVENEGDERRADYIQFHTISKGPTGSYLCLGSGVLML